MSEAIQVSGLAEAQAKLRALEKKAAKKDVRTALRAGAKVIQQAGQATAPRISGVFAKSIVVRGGRKGSRGKVQVTVTYNKRAYKDKKGFYGDFEDQGHFTGSRITKAVFQAASKTVKWSPDRRQRHSQNLALYQRLSQASGRQHIEGSHTLGNAARAKNAQAIAAFADALRSLLAEPVIQGP